VETFFQSRGSEINEKADRQFHDTNRGEKLLAVNRSELFHRLQPHHCSIIDQQVNPRKPSLNWMYSAHWAGGHGILRSLSLRQIRTIRTLFLS
jgi:hypothetical protein